jgi:Right handed beta helix region
VVGQRERGSWTKLLFNFILIAVIGSADGFAYRASGPPLSPPDISYIDCSAAHNGDGTFSHPWNSLFDATGAVFKPGNQILFKRGTVCHGLIAPKGSGAPRSPIQIGAYGTGPLPIVDGDSREEALRLYNQQYWEIRNLEVVGGDLYGIYIGGDQPNSVLTHIRLQNLNVHGAHHRSISRGDSGEVFLAPGGLHQTLTDVVVDGVTAHDTQASQGILITAGGKWVDGPSPSSGTGVTVKNSTVHDVYGDGILITELRNGLLENNVVYHTGMCPACAGSTPGGLWEWACQDCVVEGNESYANHTWGEGDGGDFDIDYHDQRNIVQYNYGHDSEGYCVSIFGAGADVDTDSIIRYNVCSNDERRVSATKKNQGDVFLATWDHGSLDGIQIYNNTFYWNPAENGPLLRTTGTEYSGTLPRFFKNNIIYSTVPLLVETTKDIALDNNIYWLTGTGSPQWVWNGQSYSGLHSFSSGTGEDTHSIYADPHLVDPSYHAVGHSTSAFTLQPDSPAINAGVDVCRGIRQCSMGKRDYFGNALDEARPGTNIGAYQGH